MSYNLANLPKEEMDKVNVDLAASGVAYKERITERGARGYQTALRRFICKWLRPTGKDKQIKSRQKYCST